MNNNTNKQLLKEAISHIDIKNLDMRGLMNAMGHMAFTSRDVSRATEYFESMLRDKDCTIL